MFAIRDYFFGLKKKAKYFYKYLVSKISDNKKSDDSYLNMKSFLTEFQYASKEEINDYQFKELKKIIEYGYNNIPYYRNLFNENNLIPNDISSLNDLNRIPFLTKNLIRENYNNLISKSINEEEIKVNKTGGTTGVPLQFVTEKYKTQILEKAFVERHFNWGDYNDKEVKLVLRGKKFINTGFKNWWWEFDPIKKALYISSDHLPNLEPHKILNLLKEYRPIYVQAYPSSVYQLAKKLINNAEKVDFIKSVFTSSETLYEDQKVFIEKVLSAKIFDLYGHREKAAMIHQCEKGSYHIIPEYGIIELCKPKFENEHGALEIVASGFNNYAMPFIRYRTGDLAIPETENCDCGRNHKLVKKIIGREQDYFVNKNGIKIPLISNKAYSIIFKLTANVKEFKYHQDKEGCVTILILPDDEYSKYDEDLIIKKFFDLFKGIEFKIKTVNNIKKTSMGKLKIIDQYIK